MKIFTRILLVCGSFLGVLCAEDPPMRRSDQPGRARPPAVEKFFSELEQKDPEEMKRLRELRRTDPKAFREELRRRVNRKKTPHNGSPKESRAVFEEAVRDIQEAPSAEAREQAVLKLRESVAKRIDNGLALREEAIERLRSRLSSLEERHLKEKKNRDQLISRQMQRLLNEPESE